MSKHSNWTHDEDDFSWWAWWNDQDDDADQTDDDDNDDDGAPGAADDDDQDDDDGQVGAVDDDDGAAADDDDDDGADDDDDDDDGADDEDDDDDDDDDVADDEDDDDNDDDDDDEDEDDDDDDGVGQPIMAATDEDTAVSIDVLVGGESDDDDGLVIVSFDPVSDGGAPITEVGVELVFDPSGVYDHLTEGQMTTDTFTVVLGEPDDDEFEDLVTKEVTVKITGINDAPVANDDGVVFVEAGDTVFVDVAGNDTDVDGMVDPSTLQFFGADNGAASETGGQLQYDANPLVLDLVDGSVGDALTYTVEDNDGAVSNPGNLVVKVIDPNLEQDVDAQQGGNGQNIALSLSTEDRTFNDTSVAGIEINSGNLGQQNINVVFIFDGSGSVSGSNNGGPGSPFAQEVAAIQTTINSLRAEFNGAAAQIDVKLIQFASGINQQSGTIDLYDTSLDNVAALPVATFGGGGTNFLPPLQLATNFLNAEPAGEQNFVFFTSDGQAPSNFAAQASSLQAIADVQAFGFGFANPTQLNIVDSDTAIISPSASDLANAFSTSPLFAADLIEFTLTVNDGSGPVEVADEGDLTSLGAGDFELNTLLTGLDNALGGTNTIFAEATFDIDNDGIADETRTVQTVINGTDGSDVIFA